MKFLLVSDKEDPYIWDHFDKARFADIDAVISCGDLKAEYLSFLVTMVNKPLFYVPGNHDKTYLKEPPEGCTCIDGQFVEFMGMRIVGFGGSMRYNLGEFQYTETEMRSRVWKLRLKIYRKRGFDILVTHSPARGLGDGKDLCHVGFQCFADLIKTQQPRYHFHGHNHLEYGKLARVIHAGPTTIVNSTGYYIVDTEAEA